MKALHYALISSIASIGGATFGSFFITEPNAIATVACILLFAITFVKYLQANINVEE